ncbi:hypothetical protein FGIG_08249 [Fasciola gigantica]|uniref:Transposase domain-containing protein n=1 Tax=Fasciola gigantica TaxID=46835 RepID=A0A504YCE8_FASGI|nr:hypothetical protein FGIG_08249 [Fasciola gigantica]
MSLTFPFDGSSQQLVPVLQTSDEPDDLVRISSSGEINTDCEVEPDAVHQPTDVGAPDIPTSIYRQVLLDLPTDPRTLFGSSRQTPKKSVGNGKYVHFVLNESLQRAMDSSAMHTTDEIAIQLHVEGLTLFCGSSQQLWPILGRVLKPLSRVFMVGLYCGMTKPADVMEYLDDCVRELKSLLAEGIYVQSAFRLFRVVLSSVIADATAKALIKQIKHQSGYFSCPRCTQRGSSIGRRLVSSGNPGESRTDVEFCCRRQPDHHTGDSPYNSLSSDMINTFQTDYIHMLCLGIMKQTLLLWRQFGKPRRALLSAQ